MRSVFEEACAGLVTSKRGEEIGRIDFPVACGPPDMEMECLSSGRLGRLR